MVSLSSVKLVEILVQLFFFVIYFLVMGIQFWHVHKVLAVGTIGKIFIFGGECEIFRREYRPSGKSTKLGSDQNFC